MANSSNGGPTRPAVEALQKDIQNLPESRKAQADIDRANKLYERLKEFNKALQDYRAGTSNPPNMKRGGTVAKTGVYKLHKGEKVIPARPARAAPRRKK